MTELLVASFDAGRFKILFESDVKQLKRI